MINRAVILAVIFGSMAHAQTPENTISVEAFLEDPERYDGLQISLEGFLSLEDYAKALFTDVEAYEASLFQDSIPVVLGNYLLDRRELYERRRVRIDGTYDHECAGEGVFCTAHPGQGRIWVRGIDVLPDQPDSPGWRQRDVSVAPYALEPAGTETGLLESATALFADIARRNRVRLRRAASGEAGEALLSDLYDPQGRSSWLLFSHERSYASWIEEHPDAVLYGFTLASDPSLPRLGAACLCANPDCAPARDLLADRIVQRNTSDPYICLTFAEIGQAWEVDAGLLLSMPLMDDYGNDLGIVLHDDREAGEELVWRFSTTPGLTHSNFVTRLRNQPRPRIWHHVRNGQSGIGIMIRRPDGQIWSMEPNDGDALLTLQSGFPDGLPDLDAPAGDNR